MNKKTFYIFSIFIIAAIPAWSVYGGYITRSFKAQSEIPSGSLVSLDRSGENQVILASNDNAEQLVGVVIEESDSSIGLDIEEGEVSVTSAGTVEVYATDVNGEINIGDSITTSPVAGMGMKASVNSRVIGTAKSAFKELDGQVEVFSKDGTKKDARVGKVSTAIQVNSYDSSFRPNNPLEKFVFFVTGKEVSRERLLLCASFLAIVFTIIIVTAFTATKTSITALGRNPLAKKKIYYGMAGVLGTILGLSAISMLIAYGILTW